MNEVYSILFIFIVKIDMRVKRLNVLGFGRVIIKKNMIKFKMELNEFCILVIIFFFCLGMVFWNSCEMVRLDN